MNRIKILIASHKPDCVYSDDVYTPIHVGRTISIHREVMSNLIGDDTCDNISHKNKEYCELTAIYWAWKNIKDADYIGLAHYHRYFETKYSKDNINLLMNTYDVILAKPFLHDRCLEFKLARELCMEDEAIFLSTLKRLYPSYENDALNYLYDYVDYPFNMFVMKKNVFNTYCEFLFTVLFECEKVMRPLPYTCSSRRMGYIAEFLLPIFCLHNKLRIKEDPVVPMIGDKVNRKNEFLQRIKIKLLHKIYDKHCPKKLDDITWNATKLGLINDGIELL